MHKDEERRLDEAKEGADAAMRLDNKFLWHAWHKKMAELHLRLSEEHSAKAERLEPGLDA